MVTLISPCFKNSVNQDILICTSVCFVCCVLISGSKHGLWSPSSMPAPQLIYCDLSMGLHICRVGIMTVLKETSCED